MEASIITKEGHPTLFEACEVISHDRGSGAGHKSYTIPVGREVADLAEAELREFRATASEDAWNTFLCGDQDLADEIRAQGKVTAADAVLGLFFEDGGCPVCDAPEDAG